MYNMDIETMQLDIMDDNDKPNFLIVEKRSNVHYLMK